MATTVGLLGLGRVGIRKIIMIEADKVPPRFKDAMGKSFTTRQQFERFKQLAGFAPAKKTNEGEKVGYQDFAPLYVRDFTPVNYTLGVKISVQTVFTDQYSIVSNLAPHFARSFAHAKNIAASNILNNGFSATTDGVNSETLYANAASPHAMGTGGPTFPNRPTPDLVFGPLALNQASAEVRKQTSARGTPMVYVGKLAVTVPLDLESNLYTVMNSVLLPGTNDNDTNYARTRYVPFVNEYLTSTKAWHVRAMDDEAHGLFHLQQMPYQIERLPMDDDLMNRWIAWESYVDGWYDAHGTWGTSP